MTAPDRIPCLKPGCRRTAKREPNDPPDVQIVCGKCWKTVPPRLRVRYKNLRKRGKKLDRLIQKARRASRAQVQHSRWMDLHEAHDRLWQKLWADIVSSLQKPDKPEGLEVFLEEMNMTDG